MAKRVGIALEEIINALREKGYNIYPGCFSLNDAATVKRRPSARLLDERDYTIFPAASVGSIRKIEQFVRRFNIKSLITTPFPVILNENQGRQSELGARTELEMIGFGIDNSHIKLNSVEGYIIMTRAEFLEAIQTLPNMAFNLFLDKADRRIANNSILDISTNRQFVPWIMAKKGLGWKGNRTEVHANYYEGGERYWIKINVARGISIVGPEGDIVFDDQLNPPIIEGLMSALA